MVIAMLVYRLNLIFIVNKKEQLKNQPTTGLIQRLINNTHLWSSGVIVAVKFCLRKCDCLLFTSLSCMENGVLPNQKGE